MSEASTQYDGFISYSHAADDLLAPRLQSGLQRFAKPWWKRRALRIFRDESSLSANPHLWSSITEALDQSGWFVLLLSPDAAESPWVNQEIEYWKEHKEPSRILPVLTDGTFEWTNGDVTGTAVPEQLQGVFTEEPRWVDMRFAKDETDLDLKDPRFADAVADIASALRGVPKDELASEEVKQHRRTIRTAWAAGALVLVLGIAAVFAAVRASENANEARQLAESEAAARAAEADSREEAEANAELAQQQAALASARELAASAINVLDDDPQLSILLGLESLARAGEIEAPLESQVALRQATHSTNLLDTVPIPGEELVAYGALSPDGSELAILSAELATVHLLDTSSWEQKWVYSDASTVDFPSELYYSRDGQTLAFSLVDSSSRGFPAASRPDEPDDHPTRIVLLDTSDGSQITEHEFGPCPGVILGPQSPDGSYWPIVTSDDEACEGPAGQWRLELRDSENFEVMESFPLPSISIIGNWSQDSRLLTTSSFSGRTLVHDVTSGERVADLAEGSAFFPVISPDGSLLAAHDFGFVVSVFDVVTGEPIDRLAGLSATPASILFADDGGSVIAGSTGNKTIRWDVQSGISSKTMPATGPTSLRGGTALDSEAQVLYHLGRGQVTTWDLSGRSDGELNSQLFGAFAQGNAMASSDSRGSVLTFGNGWDLMEFDPRTGELGDESLSVLMGNAAPVLDDGRVLAIAASGSYLDDDFEVGPVVAWDPSDGSQTVVAGCAARFEDLTEVQQARFAGPCAEGDEEWLAVERIFWNPTIDRILISTQFGELLIYDPDTLSMLSRHNLDDEAGGVEAFGDGWVAVSSARTAISTSQGNETLTIVDLDSGEATASLGRFVGTELSADGRLLAVHDGPGRVSVYETETWEVSSSVGLGDARIRGLAFSGDSSMLMTGGTDGFMRVWDLQREVETDRVPLEGVSDGYWLDDQHIVVATSEGLWTTITLDTSELINLAQSRLDRSFTPDECEVYRIDPCPTLDEIRER